MRRSTKRKYKKRVMVVIGIVALCCLSIIGVRLNEKHKNNLDEVVANYNIEQLRRSEKNELDDIEAVNLVDEIINDEAIPLGAPGGEGDGSHNIEETVSAIVWFGTAISECGNEAAVAYPIGVGQMLDIPVINDSIANSSLRAGSYMHRTLEDPMGYSGMNWDVLLKSMSLSSDEKIKIFEEWSYWRDKLQGMPPLEIEEEEKEFYLSLSWNVLFKKFTFDSEDQILFVFDHGHNDVIMNRWDDTRELGAIAKDEEDRAYYIGALEFLINRLEGMNPGSKVCMIGHYENDYKQSIAKAQEIAANHLGIPLHRTWTDTNWSQNVIEVEGEWLDGLWVENGVKKEVTQLARALPDGLMPCSDESGDALRLLTSIHYEFIRDLY